MKCKFKPIKKKSKKNIKKNEIYLNPSQKPNPKSHFKKFLTKKNLKCEIYLFPTYLS